MDLAKDRNIQLLLNLEIARRVIATEVTLIEKICRPILIDRQSKIAAVGLWREKYHQARTQVEIVLLKE